MTALAIFVKTPGHSPIKTRLAAGIGESAALAWYEHALAAVVSVARAAARPGLDPVYFAVAEAAALDDPRWSTLPRVAQGEGELGARMARVHSSLVARHGAALLLGADAPQLVPAEIADALRRLDPDEARALLGPAHDGGFWLFGANRTYASRHWSAVAYSAADTARQFVQTLGRADPEVRWEHLASHRDVDTADDLAALLDEAASLRAPTAEQAACFALSRELVGSP